MNKELNSVCDSTTLGWSVPVVVTVFDAIMDAVCSSECAPRSQRIKVFALRRPVAAEACILRGPRSNAGKAQRKVSARA